jgi:hypothetical protein
LMIVRPIERRSALIVIAIAVVGRNALILHQDRLPQSQKMLHTAQYVRMSTDHQKYSIANQAVVIAAYAELHQLSIVRTYPLGGNADLAEWLVRSGTAPDRPQHSKGKYTAAQRDAGRGIRQAVMLSRGCIAPVSAQADDRPIARTRRPLTANAAPEAGSNQRAISNAGRISTGDPLLETLGSRSRVSWQEWALPRLTTSIRSGSGPIWRT